MVTQSPWPLVNAVSSSGVVFSMLKLFYFLITDLLVFSIMNLIAVSFSWWEDVVREGTFLGNHTFLVESELSSGFILFIISEILFFFSFFWSFFHSSLSPAIQMGESWPSENISSFDPFNIPLLNSLILLTSGASVTWSHFNLILEKKNESMMSLMVTIMLGGYFTYIQLEEYIESSFCINDSVYSSIFFSATGFHGIHVIIGTLFLLVQLFRMMGNHFSKIHHFGFEAAIWYWHFVDMVWLFLFISVYWWGGGVF